MLSAEVSTAFNSPAPENKQGTLAHFPFHVIVRNLGVSVLRQVDHQDSLAQLEMAMNFDLSQALKIAEKIEGMHFREDQISDFYLNCSSLSDTELLVRVGTGVKLCISKLLYSLKESIHADPSRMKDYFQIAF